MSSFKLEKGGSAKQQAVQGGAFLTIIGLVVAVLVYLPAGILMIILGLVAILGGKFASS